MFICFLFFSYLGLLDEKASCVAVALMAELTRDVVLALYWVLYFLAISRKGIY